MTIEQLEKANKIADKIQKLNSFRNAFICKSQPNRIIAEYVIYPLIGDAVYKDSRIVLDDFPDLQDFISGYFSDKIAELEKQLEEL